MSLKSTVCLPYMYAMCAGHNVHLNDLSLGFQQRILSVNSLYWNKVNVGFRSKSKIHPSGGIPMKGWPTLGTGLRGLIDQM